MDIHHNNRHLSLFENYSQSSDSEVNAVRSLLTTLRLSGPGCFLLKPVLDLIKDELVNTDQSFRKPSDRLLSNLGKWPDRLEFDLEVDVSGNADSSDTGVLVCLVPSSSVEETEKAIDKVLSGDLASRDNGRMDASIRASFYEDGKEEVDSCCDLAVFFEAKIYDHVGESQIKKYLSYMEEGVQGDNNPPVIVLSWERIHSKFRRIIIESSFSSTIVSEFMAYMEKRSSLRFFYGLRGSSFKEDKGVPSEDFEGLAIEVRRDADYLLSEELRYVDPIGHEGGGYYEGHETKRGRSFDVDFQSVGRTKRFGNTGIAHWVNDEISTKLVIGSGSRGEMDSFRSWLSSESGHDYFKGWLTKLFDNFSEKNTRIIITARIRVFWGRFREEYIDAAICDLGVSRYEDVISGIGYVIEEFHGSGEVIKDGDTAQEGGNSEKKLSEWARRPIGNANLANTEYGQEVLNKVFKSDSDDRPKTFVYFYVKIAHNPEWFEARFSENKEKPQDLQVKALTDEIVTLEKLLQIVQV